MPYIGFEPTASDTLSVFKYVATGSQTTFTGADAGGATLSYDVGDGSCQVWLNGVRLDSSDITATNGTSVVLAACTAGDIVHVQATKAFLPSDAVSASAGGTFASAVTVSGTITGTAVTSTGDVTGLTFNATGDTSHSDNAAIGYTAAEGLILTGQGSTNDITIKRDDDTAVLEVATGQSNIEVTGGSILFGTADRGVYLGVTSATAANLLDDYEEGTWTPVLTGTTSLSGTQTYGNTSGKYCKVGAMVFCHMTIGLTAKATISGSLAITGLPFTGPSAAGYWDVGVSIGYIDGIDLSAGHVLLMRGRPDQPDVILQECEYQDDAANTLTTSNIATPVYIYASFSYFAETVST